VPSLEAKCNRYRLAFKKPAGTSRGFLNYKDSWFIKLSRKGEKQINYYGECGFLKGLSIDPAHSFETTLEKICQNINSIENLDINLDTYPSIKFALEMVFKDFYNGPRFSLFSNSFTNGNKGIPINGLIWMASKKDMKSQIKAKIEAGYSCIKIKIGAIDINDEIALLRYIRSEFQHENLIIRLDANGAFKSEEALDILDRISDYRIHSIEQPIMSGQYNEMAELCRRSSIPIALDEELIPIRTSKEKMDLIDYIKPAYIILKPSLLGGFQSCDEWIHIAQKNNIGWWITSALESNVGLNAIAQYTAEKEVSIPQGLGTGGLYSNNFDSSLKIIDGELFNLPDKSWKVNLSS
jgi:o-succinylbenzoate synthase